jgi:hypothetical protein
MGEWTITAVDPDEMAEGTVGVVHGTAGEALAKGCEAILDGYLSVTVDGPFGTRYVMVP